jgi:hypothetical protein
MKVDGFLLLLLLLHRRLLLLWRGSVLGLRCRHVIRVLLLLLLMMLLLLGGCREMRRRLPSSTRGLFHGECGTIRFDSALRWIAAAIALLLARERESPSRALLPSVVACGCQGADPLPYGVV